MQGVSRFKYQILNYMLPHEPHAESVRQYVLCHDMYGYLCMLHAHQCRLVECLAKMLKTTPQWSVDVLASSVAGKSCEIGIAESV